eukprot:Gb_07577 [translate_table: standard]
MSLKNVRGNLKNPGLEFLSKPQALEHQVDHFISFRAKVLQISSICLRSSRNEGELLLQPRIAGCIPWDRAKSKLCSLEQGKLFERMRSCGGEGGCGLFPSQALPCCSWLKTFTPGFCAWHQEQWSVEMKDDGKPEEKGEQSCDDTPTVMFPFRLQTVDNVFVGWMVVVSPFLCQSVPLHGSCKLFWFDQSGIGYGKLVVLVDVHARLVEQGFCRYMEKVTVENNECKITFDIKYKMRDALCMEKFRKRSASQQSRKCSRIAYQQVAHTQLRLRPRARSSMERGLDQHHNMRNENAKASAKEFQQDFQNGTLDTGPSAAGALSPSAKRGQDIDHTSEDDADATGRSRKHGKNYARENELCSAAPKAPLVCSEPRRVLKDIDQGFALIRKLDTEKGIEENILVTSEQDKMDGELRVSMGPTVTVRGANTVKGLEDLELLDVLITYLWRVHAIDYYGMIELKEFPKGLRHIRVEGKNNIEEQSTKSAEWEKKLDMTWQIRLQGEDPLELLLAKEKLEIAATEALDPYIRKIRDEKYGCGAKGCTKLFHAPEFVRKHLRLKHAELVADSISKAREEIYYQNYMNDSNAPGVSVTTQQHGQGDRIWRNKARLGIATEATYHDRDIDHHDSSSCRENDRVDSLHEEDQYDRSEDSLSRDYPLIPGGPAYDSADAGHSDPSMFDHFTGSAPFGSDMACPPPVLMPVPGAGPLGPFVPAPPEVAMRMMSEQSGSTPLHSGEKKGGPPGQKGCSSGHSMGGMMDPSANLPMAPALRQDPRHLRNYNDLDVPEDEVTVIDYRSL